LGYFMARIYLFLTKCGVDPQKLRFRQHMSNEMAHYASDCWDAEILTSYGWIECVGCADRSCYDLNQHSKASGVKLVAEKMLPQPKEVDVLEAVPVKAVLGKTFGKNSKPVLDALTALDEAQVLQMETKFNENESYSLTIPESDPVNITKDMVTIKKYKKKVHVEDVTPGVIEPSFGIGRIMYAIFEHTFRVREDDGKRGYLSLPPLIAPIKCSLLPLSNNPQFAPFLQQISADLTRNDVSHRIDDSSGSIGKRYARTDEIAIPFGITVDFDTLNKPHTTTLRERDSMKQIRVPIEDLGKLLSDLCNGIRSWQDVMSSYPAFEQQEASKREQ